MNFWAWMMDYGNRQIFRRLGHFNSDDPRIWWKQATRRKPPNALAELVVVFILMSEQRPNAITQMSTSYATRRWNLLENNRKQTTERHPWCVTFTWTIATVFSDDLQMSFLASVPACRSSKASQTNNWLKFSSSQRAIIREERTNCFVIRKLSGRPALL
jgi:hypothetical protein